MMAVRVRYLQTIACVGVLVVLACALIGIVAPESAEALYLTDSDIPGKPLTAGGSDYLSAVRINVVHRVYLLAGQTAVINMTGDAGTDFNLYLYGPEADSFMTSSFIDQSDVFGTSDEQILYTAPASGWYYVLVRRATGTGHCMVACTTMWPVPRDGTTPIRLWGQDRYVTACVIAAQNYPSWRNVDHVIIASGEDRAAADPLSAAGLAWAYGGPVFLVRSDSAPDCVVQALEDIRAQNGQLFVHIVGGPVSVGFDALDQIRAHIPDVTFDRIAPYNDRYTLAASIARRMEEERPEDSLNRYVGAPAGALIANGEDPDKFFDALALSPVCVTIGRPILLVRKDSIPAPTAQVLADLNLEHRAVAGGPATVSDGVFAQLEEGDVMCVRFWGRDRYETAEAIMRAYIGIAGHIPRYLFPANSGVVAKLPDALTGGAFLGLRRGCILLTQTSSLPTPTRDFLSDRSHEIGKAFVFGGPNSVDPDAYNAVDAALDP